MPSIHAMTIAVFAFARAATAAPSLGSPPSQAPRHAFSRRRTNLTPHTPEDLEYLVHFNDWITLYYWIGLLGLLGIVTVANFTLKFQGYLRRRSAGFRSKTKRLPRVKSIEPRAHHEEPEIVHHISARYFFHWLSAFWRKYSIKHSHIAEFFYLGNLGQVALITVYLTLNFLFIFLGALGDIDWQAHHAAKLTYANLPLVIGLAGKNNVLSKMTGFAYESLNVLHRWSARFIIITSAIHIGGRIYVNVPNVHPDRAGQRYIAWGWLAFAAFIYMIFMASRPFRNRAYQFFLGQHLFLWFIIVASLVIHRPQEQGWIWAGFALHLLDWVARGIRIIKYHGVKRVDPKVDAPEGTVQALSEDTILVTVRTRQNWIPAQHVYLHCPNTSPGGHPFTVCNISRPLTQTDNKRPREASQELLIRVREGLTRKLFDIAVAAKDDETAVEGKRSRFQKPREPVPLFAWTEGPYGHEKYLGEDYDTLLLVAGGSGVSYALSNALDLVRRARAMAEGPVSDSVAIALKRLSFVWMVKKPEQVAWIGRHIKAMAEAAPPGFLHITIYITGKRERDEPPVLEGYITHDQRSPVPDADDTGDASPSSSSSPPMATAGDAEKKAQGSNKPRRDSAKRSTSDEVVLPSKERVRHGAVIQLRSGRPDFNEIVAHELAETAYEDWVAIGACGPTPMNDSLADAVSKSVKPTAVLRGEVRRNIYLTIEEFGW